MEFNSKLVKLARDITDIKVIEVTDIPDIDLYMDQVTTFMETKLETHKRNKADKILTKTMINNYAKARLFPPPIKKKYNRNHMMILIIIYHLKSILSINDIQVLLSPISNEIIKNPKSALLDLVYTNFVIIQKHIKNAKIGEVLTNQQIFSNLEIDQTSPNYDLMVNIFSVLILSIYSNTEKRLAEKILDTQFK